MVLRWHRSRKEYVFEWKDWPLWENAAIGRKLSAAGAAAVVEELIRTGHAEWNDAGKSMVTLMWHSVEEIAAKLFDFVRKHDMVGSVFTVYELHQGDEVLGTVSNEPVVNITLPMYTPPIRYNICLLYTSPSPRDKRQTRMPSSA